MESPGSGPDAHSPSRCSCGDAFLASEHHGDCKWLINKTSAHAAEPRRAGGIVGWSDKAIARARLAAAKAAEVSKEVLAEADEALLAARPGYSEVKSAVSDTAAEA